MWYVVISIIAYLIGSISSSVIISKKMAGFDVREKGSHNAGSTNMLRTVGKKAALITLICDILKGVVAVLIAFAIGTIANAPSHILSIYCELAGFFVVLGHTFPIFFGFKGGKGVATSLGVLLILNWQVGLICLVFALAVMAISRYVSLGSISAAVLFPVLVAFIETNYLTGFKYFGGYIKGSDRISWIVFGIALALLVIFNHRSNIVRLREGKENKLSFKKKPEAEQNGYNDEAGSGSSTTTVEEDNLENVGDVPEIKVDKKDKNDK